MQWEFPPELSDCCVESPTGGARVTRLTGLPAEGRYGDTRSGVEEKEAPTR